MSDCGYVLDTSALLTYIENEEGVEQIERLLLDALDNKTKLFMSVLSALEIFYISWREQGEAIAEERLTLLQSLPISQEPVATPLVRIAGNIKARKHLSLADACIAGLAKSKNAVLVHKDPEFEQLAKEITLRPLPYKSQ